MTINQLNTDASDTRKIIVLASGSLMLILLFLWNRLLQHYDAAIFTLLPIFLLLFFSSWKVKSSAHHARARIVIRKESRYARWFTGRFRALLSAVLFALLATFLLAAFATAANEFDWLLLLGVVLLAQFLYFTFSDRLTPHVTPPFKKLGVIWIVGTIILLICVPIIAWINWFYKDLPIGLSEATLFQAIELGLESLPRRGGILTNALSFIYALNHIKLWLVLQVQSYPMLAGAIYSADAALAYFVAAQSSANLMTLIKK